MADEHVNSERRRLLTVATTGVGLAGAVGMAVPFAGSLVPSERAKSAGAPVEVDISKLESGQQLTIEWRGKPVWIIRRSEEMLAHLSGLNPILLDPDSERAQQPAYAKNLHRSIKEDILVLVGICTHLGCSPSYQPDIGAVAFDADWKGGFLCACHGSKFDMSGRVYSGVPAPSNLIVPPHQYLTETVLQIGEDGGLA